MKKRDFKQRDKDEKRPPRRKVVEENGTADHRGDTGQIRLNKYLAHAGVCSRREADKLIETGVVRVNGKIIRELGTKVKPGDKIQLGEQTLKMERPVYVLLNKPKDYITTSSDPQNRKTVMELIRNACPERLYPVGRLDRNTTGVLLLTNDGEMADKLTHPSRKVRKLYHVWLDKKMKTSDLDVVRAGLELEDGFIRVDAVEFIEGENDKSQVGVELHSGRNRIVRRIFEHLGYKVIRLDRVSFAGLTKHNLPRGKYRYLTDREISYLKML
ncbi:MAG: rRNA pseudouridine synthase [Bacteroidetes bacterium]|nr:rRNA pseudouridine synthase [Bacteroidota bacterium]